jgi:hypothetical protein
MTDLPALEAALRKKAAEAMKCRALMSTRTSERELMAVAAAYTDAADMVAAMMREGEK